MRQEDWQSDRLVGEELITPAIMTTLGFLSNMKHDLEASNAKNESQSEKSFENRHLSFSALDIE